MQEVQGSNPGAAPPTFGQFGAQIHPHTPPKVQKRARASLIEGEVGAEGVWFRRARREAKKKCRFFFTTHLHERVAHVVAAQVAVVLHGLAAAQEGVDVVEHGVVVRVLDAALVVGVDGHLQGAHGAVVEGGGGAARARGGLT